MNPKDPFTTTAAPAAWGTAMQTRQSRLPIVLGLLVSLSALALAPELAGARTIRVDRGIDFFPGSDLANDGFVEIPIESRMETPPDGTRVPVPFSIRKPS